jgi:hypothetical protein
MDAGSPVCDADTARLRPCGSGAPLCDLECRDEDIGVNWQCSSDMHGSCYEPRPTEAGVPRRVCDAGGLDGEGYQRECGEAPGTCDVECSGMVPSTVCDVDEHGSCHRYVCAELGEDCSARDCCDRRHACEPISTTCQAVDGGV